MTEFIFLMNSLTSVWGKVIGLTYLCPATLFLQYGNCLYHFSKRRTCAYGCVKSFNRLVFIEHIRADDTQYNCKYQ